ncbi:MAG: hypothetical protein FWC54_00660 [Actinomycetia bacterium]|nr:hypothetical protein [Actinomycetes bacterium]
MDSPQVQPTPPQSAAPLPQAQPLPQAPPAQSVWQTPAPQLLPQAPQPRRSKWSAGKIVALVLGICALLALITAGIGYAAWTARQRELEAQRQAAEKARLAAIARNVELFRGDMKEFLERKPTTEKQGLTISATGEVGAFEMFFNSQLQDYLKATGDHDSDAVSFFNTQASLSSIASDNDSLSGSRAALAAMQKRSAEFYDANKGLFDQKIFEDQLETSTLPTDTKDELVQIALQYTTRFTAALAQAQQAEDNAWKLNGDLYDLLVAKHGSWKVSGSSLEWYSESGYNQSKQLSADQSSALEKALDTLWNVAAIKMLRSGLTA